MPTTSKYFVTSTVSGQNWLDFDLNIEQLKLAGQDFIFTGSNSVDAVRIGPGVIFDFTKSNGGKDNLFLSGRLGDYTMTPATSTLTLERGSGATYEKVVVAKGTSTNFDNVIFADGTASTFDLHAKASGALPGLTLAASLSAPTTLSATVKAFALDSTGEVFAPSAKGVNYILTGSNAVDLVYVNPGATIDATKLNGGVDEIYFTGNWADYVKEVFTSKLVFTNAVTGDNVTVAAGAGASNDRLVFADGSVQTSNAKTALTGSLSAAISSVTGFDVSKTTPGLAPKITSLVDDVINLDVTSPIVLKASQSVTPVAGKYIRLMNDGGVGFRGEASDQDLLIETTSSNVTISGDLIIIRPPFHLDLANDYHLEIDAGAFVNPQAKGNAAVSDATTINFSTVTPGSGLLGVASAVQSQSMSVATGALQNSFKWLDIEGVGSPSSSSGTVLDLSVGDIALVFKDYDPAPGSESQATDGVGAPDFYVRAGGFAAGDLVYADNQTPTQANLLSQTQVLADTPAAGVTTVSFGTGTSGLGGVVEVTLAGSTGTFGSIDALRALLGLSYAPFSESGTPPVTIQGLSAGDVAAEGTVASYTVTLSAPAPAGGFVVDWRVSASATDSAQAQDFGSATPMTSFPTGSITIAAGATTGQITVPVFDDTLPEGAERFVLQAGKLTSGTFASAAQWTTTITASDQAAADTTPPSPQAATVSTDGRLITVTFNEGLDIASASSAELLARFSVTAGLAGNWPLKSAQVVGSTVVLTTEDYAPIPQPANLNPSTVSVSYTDFSAGNDATAVLQDYPAGNDVAPFTLSAANNSTYNPSGPTLPNVESVSGSFSATEGMANTYTVTLDADAPVGGMTLEWRVMPAASGDSASADDFQSAPGVAGQLPSGQIFFGTGQRQASVTLSIGNDTTPEPAEGYFFKVGKLGAGGTFVPIDGAEAYTVIQASDQTADTQAPDLSIGANTQKILASDYVSIQFSFTEPVSGFDLSDVTVTGGTLSNLYKSSEDFYVATFRPNSGFDGQSTFSVAAGRYADQAGNLNTQVSTLSVPTFALQPGNSGSTTFSTNTTTGNSDIVVRFSEAIYQDVAAAPLAGFTLALNPSADNGFNGAGSVQPQIVGWEYTPGGDGTAITLMTNALFGATDFVRVSINGYNTSFRDADGNELAGQEIYIGGSGNNTINLDWYGSSSRQILRGNGGNDELIGTYNADSFVDGGGVDFIDPVGGGDSISLVENGLTGTGGIAYARDTVMIGLGDSRRGVGNTDLIRFDPAQSSSGFDWFSSNNGNHDALLLESGLIADTASFVAAPAAQGGITGHSIAAGIVTFRNSAGGEVAITQATNLGNALDYLRFNLQAPGHTVAFKADYDNNGVAESLFVYQDMGKLPLAGNAEMPDIVIRVEQPATAAVGATVSDRLSSVTLGNAPGANVLEIQDGFAPEPMAIDLAANGVVMNFVEPVTATTSLAVTLQVNGTGPVYTPSVVSGSGTAALLIQCATLANGTVSMQATDWALITYAGSTATNAFVDLAGNVLKATDDDGNPVTHAFVLGGSGNNSIDLSGYAVSGWGMDIEAGAGDDDIRGTASHDWIWAGSGVDQLRGGQGADEFEFAQGDSPVLTLNTSTATDTYMLTGATYTFAGGKAEVIEDFQVGDTVRLNPPFDGLTGGGWLGPMSGSSASGPGMSGGLVTDQRFLGVRGTLGTNGVFTVGSFGTGPDTLVIYDGDAGSGVSQTGFVLRGVALSEIDGLDGYSGGNTLRLRASAPVNGTEGNDTLFGNTGADIINGWGGDDFLEGRGGADTLNGGDGNDYLVGGDGNDALDGGAGNNDVAAYWFGGQTSPVNFTATWRTTGQQADGTGGIDTLSNIEELHFSGGSANDTLVGDSGRNYMQGEGGNDSLTGGGGNDTFGYSFGAGQGPQGNDTITDFTGDDQLWFNNFTIGTLSEGASTTTLMAGEVSIVVGASQTTLHIGADTAPGADFSVTLNGSFQAGGFTRNVFTGGGVTNSEIRYTAPAVGQSYTGTTGNDSFNGEAGNDTLSGGDGNDSLGGMGGDDLLQGGGGNDQLRGEDGNDTLEGGDGNDYMTGGPGNDSLVGGAGTDTADYYYQGTPVGSLGPVTVNLTTGSATGGQGNDTLSGIENVNGTDGNDTITGDANSNTITGRGGDDLLDGGGQPSGGIDFVDYRELPNPVNVNLKTGRATGGGGNDTLAGFEGIVGTSGNDTLVGSDSTTLESEVLAGGLGDDDIDGGAGFDIADFTWGNTAAITVDLVAGTATGTGIGNDTLKNIEGVIASSGNDSLKGGDGNDWFRPQGGNDTVDGGAGVDRVVYDRAPAAVTVNLSLTTAQNTGGEGTDTLLNIENLRGSAYNDSLTGSSGNNDIQGRDGNDTIRGLEGDDSLQGENGNDQLFGDDGSDTLIGGAGDDTLDGGAQRIVNSSSSVAQNVYLSSNQSNGYDVVSYSSVTAAITVALGADGTNGTATGSTIGTDKLVNIEIVVGSSASDVISGSNRSVSEIIRGNKGNDTLSGGDASGVDAGTNFVDYRFADGPVGVNLALGSSSGADGVDVLSGFQGVFASAYNDTVVGDGNDNFLRGEAGDDSLDGGLGFDMADYSSAAGSGVQVDLATGRSSGAAGNDTLVGFEGLRGSEHDDQIAGDEGSNLLQGRAGNDALAGRGGDDTIQGGYGNDSIDGGAGVDTAGFTGAFADYTVLIDTTGIRITDGVSGRDGVDQIVNVERFLFSDGEYKVNAAGTGLGALNAQAAEVLDVVQESGYPQAQNAATYEFTPDNLEDWLDGPAPLLISQVATRSQASIDGDIDDNELKYGLEYAAGTGGGAGTTTLFMRYDLDPLVGEVQPSALIELTFPGDVRTSLVPESLTFSG